MKLEKLKPNALSVANPSLTARPLVADRSSAIYCLLVCLLLTACLLFKCKTTKKIPDAVSLRPGFLIFAYGLCRRYLFITFTVVPSVLRTT